MSATHHPGRPQINATRLKILVQIIMALRMRQEHRVAQMHAALRVCEYMTKKYALIDFVPIFSALNKLILSIDGTARRS